jgi:hypothetical protein
MFFSLSAAFVLAVFANLSSVAPSHEVSPFYPDDDVSLPELFVRTHQAQINWQDESIFLAVNHVRFVPIYAAPLD